MPQVSYVFAKATSWREFAWQPGDKLVRSELPPEAAEALVNQFIAGGNVVPKDEFEPPRETNADDPQLAPKRKAKE
jgi:hypothetical protein